MPKTMLHILNVYGFDKCLFFSSSVRYTRKEAKTKKKQPKNEVMLDSELFKLGIDS